MVQLQNVTSTMAPGKDAPRHLLAAYNRNPAHKAVGSVTFAEFRKDNKPLVTSAEFCKDDKRLVIFVRAPQR